ncbi:MAG: hypothetical protein PHY93_07035 [Bacteriovorax sp.]|nr:hypothetical protein [Bacteriovorax sp.]
MKKITTLILFSLLSLSASAQTDSVSTINNSLKTFETDGCTMFIDGTPSKPGLWKHCCVEHDMRYWFGGDQKDMDKTDLRLKACVKEVAGAMWAELIYTGVRVGHSSPVKNKTHWAWGWTIERANAPLSSMESDYIIEEVRHLPYDQDLLEKFIERNFNNHNAKF